jgi:23S rRNA (pseudouridine1915-N3)-methyltransferase
VRVAVLAVGGKAGTPWADVACADYGKRLSRWVKLEEPLIRSEPFRGNIESVRRAEGERLLKHVAPRDRLIALDERGADLDTPGLRDAVEAARSESFGLCFAIGGAYGHDPATRTAAWKVVRLSAFVLNHEVARVLLYEQLYRVYADIHGVPYAH